MTKIKNKIIVALSALLVFCLAFSLAMATPTTTKANNENAVTPTVNVETILMDEGASVRTETTNGISSGIRFTLYVNAEYYASLTNPVVGMYIARATDATEADMKAGTIPEKYQHFVAQAFADDATETIQDTKSFNAVIFNIPENEFGTELIANGYIVADGVEIEFAVNPQIRSIAQVASKALANGMDDEVLFDYVDKAVELSGETLAFATETATLDRYLDEGKSADLGLTVPGSFTAIVSSSDPAVATVDANGVVTRGTKSGSTTITAQLGTSEVTATVKIKAVKPEIVTVDNESYKNIQRFDGASVLASSFVGAEEIDFEGNYSGNAVKVEVGTNNYRVKNNYSLTELNAIAQDYSSVSFWISSAGNYGTGLVSFNTTESVFAKLGMNNDNGYRFASTERADTGFGKMEKWYKVVLSIDKYIDLLTDTDGNAKEYCPIVYPWTYGLAAGAVIDLYFGDISFSNEILPVNFKNYTSVYLSGNSNYGYIASDNDAIKDFTGGYKGNAVWLKRDTTDYQDAYRFKNPYSLKELQNFKENKIYNQVSLWIAIDALTAGTARFYSKYESFVNKAGWGEKMFAATPSTSDHLQSAHWYKLSISIDDYIALVTNTETGEANNYCPLMQTWAWQSEGGAKYYIGDIFFEKVAPSIIKVDSSNFNNVIWNADNMPSYVSASDLAAAGVMGAYTGNAAKFTNMPNNGSYRIINRYTIEELIAISDEYSKVSMWMAVGGHTSGFIGFYKNLPDNSANFVSTARGGAEGNYNTYFTVNQWKKVTISIEDYINMLSTCQGDWAKGDYTSFCPLFRTYQEGPNDGRCIYIGDIFFE